MVSGGGWKVYLVVAITLLALLVTSTAASGGIVDTGAGEEDFRVLGIDALDWMGEVASGDVNGDGLDDLIIGAPGTDIGGVVYVVWGTRDGLSGTLDLKSVGPGLTVHAPQTDAYFGRAVGSGDLNGDGVDDLIIGADHSSVGNYTENGAVYVIFGSPALAGEIHLATQSAGLSVQGAASGDRLGRSLAVCDVNDDGSNDLIMGAYLAQTVGGGDAGAVFVIFGSPNVSGTVPLDVDTSGFRILGNDTHDRLGRSVACGDVNGDGIADIISGPYQANQEWGSEAGEVIVVYGSSTLSGTRDLNTQPPDVLMRGVAEGDQAGFNVATGDVNGDGIQDVLVGAYLADGRWLGSQTGSAYVVYGSSALPADLNLSTAASVTIHGEQENSRLSRSLTSGDFNADGYDDILVGASTASPAGREKAGAAYVIYGSPDLPADIHLEAGDRVAVKVLGHHAGDELGRAAAVGDLDGDGAGDLVVGALMAAGGTGEAYLIYGSAATTLAAHPALHSVMPGQTVTYTVMAHDRFGAGWPVTDRASFAIDPAAGGAWSGNVYTAEHAGIWHVVASSGTLSCSATLVVGSDLNKVYLPVVNR